LSYRRSYMFLLEDVSPMFLRRTLTT